MSLPPSRLTVTVAKAVSVPSPGAQMPGDALSLFDRAMGHFHKRRYEQAEGLFERLVEGFPEHREVVSRAQFYLQLCEKQRGGVPREFRDPDDHYYRAVVLSNRSEHGAAIHHLEEALRMLPRRKGEGKAREDVIRYLLAVSHALRGEPEAALQQLGEAIRLNERNRIQARNSAEFLPLREDPRFRALVAFEG